ncbi:MAG: hypothetical protein ACKVTZ_12005 [Bacteroidia bacterium]
MAFLKKGAYFLAGTVLFLLLTELIMRQVWGLGTVLLYQPHPILHSIVKPKQELTKFGNRILYNEESMRSLPLKTGEKRWLIIGNSVLNGGNLTHHDSLATSHLEKEFQQKKGENIRILNLSGGGWGPDVAMEYVKLFGDFEAKGIVLVVNNNNIYDNLPLISSAGMFEHLPTKQPFCAWTEVYHRYLKNKFRFWQIQKHQESKPKKVKSYPFNQGFTFFKQYCQEKKIPLAIYLHPTLSEATQQQPDIHSQTILQKLDSLQISYLSGFQFPNPLNIYRDEYHLTEEGQRVLADRLRILLEKEMKE